MCMLTATLPTSYFRLISNRYCCCSVVFSPWCSRNITPYIACSLVLGQLRNLGKLSFTFIVCYNASYQKGHNGYFAQRPHGHNTKKNNNVIVGLKAALLDQRKSWQASNRKCTFPHHIVPLHISASAAIPVHIYFLQSVGLFLILRSFGFCGNVTQGPSVNYNNNL